MQNRIKKLILVCSVALGLLLTTSFFLVSYAQKKTETQKVENQKQTEQENKARQEVAKSVVANVFLDSVMTKESDWRLIDASYISS